MYIHIHINESLCYASDTNTILQFNYTSIKKKKQTLYGLRESEVA